jgi:hypothetical protein
MTTGGEESGLTPQEEQASRAIWAFSAVRRSIDSEENFPHLIAVAVMGELLRETRELAVSDIAVAEMLGAPINDDATWRARWDAAIDRLIGDVSQWFVDDPKAKLWPLMLHLGKWSREDLSAPDGVRNVREEPFQETLSRYVYGEVEWSVATQQLVKAYAEDVARLYITDRPTRPPTLEIMRALFASPRAPDPPQRTGIERAEAAMAAQREMLSVSTSTLYHEVRATVANGRRDFDVPDGAHWPTARVARKGVDAVIEVRPNIADADPFVLSPRQLTEWQQNMANHVMQMDDLTADVLDAICAIWIGQAGHARDDVAVTVNQLLERRGLQPKRSGTGRRGGYYSQQRRAIAQRIAALRDTWVTVAEMWVPEANSKRRKMTPQQGEAPVLIVEFRVGPRTPGGSFVPDQCTGWSIRPGKVFADYLFGPGRQVGLLASKALEYDPHAQTWEKRLARYFSWLWRIRQYSGSYTDPITVRTLLEAVREPLNARKPNLTKERLEKALDQLQEDGVIAQGWQYEAGVDDGIVGQRGWARDWLLWKVTVEPPAFVTDHYATMPHQEPGARRLGGTRPAATIGQRLAQARRSRGMRLAQVAEEVDVSISRLSRIERGVVRPTEAVQRRLDHWLDGTEAASA